MGLLVEFGKTKKCVTLDHHSLEDKVLSWEAKGIHCYFMTRPPGARIGISTLTRTADNRRSFLAGIKELIRANYLFPIFRKQEKRPFFVSDYFASPVPITIEEAAVAIKKLNKGEWKMDESYV